MLINFVVVSFFAVVGVAHAVVVFTGDVLSASTSTMDIKELLKLASSKKISIASTS